MSLNSDELPFSPPSPISQRIHPARLLCLNAALKTVPFEAFRGKTILVTGARGYFGRYVVEAFLLLNEFHGTDIEIIALDSDATGTGDQWSEWRGLPHLTTTKHNLKYDLGTLYGQKPNFIFHLAGIASPYWYKKLPLETIDVAIEGTRKMLELARDTEAKMVFTSSSEVYQTASVVPTPETYIGAIPSDSDRSCYDVSKLLAETLCYVYAQESKVHVSVARIFNSFGIGMAQRDRRILTRIAEAVKRGGIVQVYGVTTVPRRTYTPVANTLRGLLFIALKGIPFGSKGAATGVYNVGSEAPELSVPELIDRIHAVTGLPTQYMYAPVPVEYATEPLRRCPDVTQLKQLGYTEAMGLDDGLRAFFAWSQEAYK